MSKIKINPGLAGIVLLACLFAGWQTLLLVVLFMLLFCEVDDKLKSIIVKVITFFAAYTLVSTAWDLIIGGVNLVIGTINDLLSLINSFLDITDQIDFTPLTQYFLNPVAKLVGMADNIVSFIFLIIKFTFIIATIQNKPTKENFVSKKINEFVTKIVNYINGIDLGNVATPAPAGNAPVQPSPVAPTPASTSTPTPAPLNSTPTNSSNVNNSTNQQQ